jgi:hypothetical protein
MPRTEHVVIHELPVQFVPAYNSLVTEARRQEQAKEKLRILPRLRRLQDEFRAIRGVPPKAWPMSLVGVEEGERPR